MALKGSGKKWFCKKCGIEVDYRRTVCKEHDPQFVDWDKTTLGDCKGKRHYQKTSRIRALARKEYFKYNSEGKCEICGYDKHIEICHIRPVKEFPETATISEINSIKNLIGLCPNHHWEFDNGLVSGLSSKQVTVIE